MFLAGQRLTADLLNLTVDPLVEVSATSDASLSNTEAVVLTLPSATFKANTAYRAWVGGGIFLSSGSTLAAFALRKGTAVGGSTIISFTRMSAISINLELHVNLQSVFVVGASDVTTQMCLSIGTNGTNTGTYKGATGGNPRHVTIYPAGDASKYTNRPTLT